MDRRDFLRIAAGAAASLLVPPQIVGAGEWVDRWWAEEQLDGAELPGAARSGQVVIPQGRYCEGRLRLTSSIHGESYDFRFRDTAGNYDQNTLSALNWFLRCKDGTWQYMDLKAIETLNYLSALLDVPKIRVNSGYRSPQYNAKLAKGNENVARNSLHQYGCALDISVPGIPIKDVCSHALLARNTMGYGGVGYYPRSDFVHLDSGPTREWGR